MKSGAVWFIVVLVSSASTATQAQAAPDSIEPGTRVRVELSQDPEEWRSGRFVSWNGDSLVVETDSGAVGYSVGDVASMEFRPRSYVLPSAGVGAATGLVLGAAFSGSSDAVGVAFIGGLIGAGLGAGKRVRTMGGMGALIGAGTGALVFGSTGTACEDGAGLDCNMIVGGVAIGILGLMTGTAIGVLLPKWESVPLEAPQIGVYTTDGGGFALSWKLRF